MPIDVARVQAVFLAAVREEWAGRAAVLDRLCDADAELRQRVETLLKAHEALGSFLEPITIDDPPLAERSGSLVGPYKLLEPIGEGGFGVVFMAEQTQPVRRKVALKVLKPGMDTRQVVARFEAERQALALMDHPNIARVFDGGATPSGRPYFVMELVRGVPITQFCDQEHLTPRQRLELFIPVCQAVQHAHQKGIIHRDLKPSNILVTVHDTTPVVKVIDFGIAKALGHELTDKTLFTGFAQMLGTPMYMSPEQAGQSGLDVDIRSDIYSLGVLLYELLTGSTPFDRSRLKEADYDEIRRIIREEEPARPSTRVSTLGPAGVTASANRQSDPQRLSQLFRGELDWIVMKALEKDRNRRYDTASAFAADVQRYLNDEPVLACPPSAWYRCRKFARRNKVILTAGSAVVLAVIVALVSLASAVTVLAGGNARIKAEQKQTSEALAREKKATQDLLEARAAAQITLYFQRLGLAQRDLAINNIGRAEELLHECAPELRGWEWHLLKRRTHEPERVVPLGKVGVVEVVGSPDGRYVATVGFTPLLLGEVKLRDAATGKEIHSLGGHLGPVIGVAFHPDSDQFATAGVDGSILLWDVTTGKLLGTLAGHDGPVPCLSYSPDGKRLASASLDGTARVWDVARRAELLRFGEHREPVSCIAFSPDGRRVASWGTDFNLRVWDAITGVEERRMSGHNGRVSSVLFHKDGRHLVSAGADGVRVWDRETGRERHALKGINSASLKVALSPDGRRLASAGWDKTVQLWDWDTAQEVLALRGHTDLVLGVGFSGDGRRLFSVSLDNTLRIWDATPLGLDPPGPERRLQGHQAQILSMAFSPDQRSLATASMDGTARLWDVRSRKLPRTLPGHDKMVTSVAFHGGGKLLSTATVDGTLVLWDAATGERRRTLQGHLGPVLNVGFNASFSADGERLAVLGKDSAVRVWQTETAREVGNTKPAVPPHLCAFLSPYGERLAIATMGPIKIWEIRSGKLVASLWLGFHVPHHLAFSADGKHLAAAVWDGTVKVWEIKSGKLLHTFRHADRVTCVAFHPNGKQLASGSCDNTAKVWDLETGEEVVTLHGHIGYVMTLAYSHDGKLLATASGHRYAGEVQVWETADFGKKR